MFALKTLSIGRSLERDVVINDDSVSRKHAEITLARDLRIFVIDAASAAGTSILRNGGWVDVRQDYLNPGEVLRVGSVEFDEDQIREWLERPDNAGSVFV